MEQKDISKYPMKLTGKHSDREFDPLLKINDNYPKYLITKDDNEYEGIEKKHIINFLTGDWWE